MAIFHQQGDVLQKAHWGLHGSGTIPAARQYNDDLKYSMIRLFNNDYGSMFSTVQYGSLSKIGFGSTNDRLIIDDVSVTGNTRQCERHLAGGSHSDNFNSQWSLQGFLPGNYILPGIYRTCK